QLDSLSWIYGSQPRSRRTPRAESGAATNTRPDVLLIVPQPNSRRPRNRATSIRTHPKEGTMARTLTTRKWPRTGRTIDRRTSAPLRAAATDLNRDELAEAIP